MTLDRLYLLIVAALVLRLFPLKNLRKWGLLIASVGLIFWLQPALPIRYLDFYLPVILIGIIFLSWYFLTPKDERFTKNNIVTMIVISASVLLINLTRLINLTGVITPSRPPRFFFLIGGLILVAGLSLLLNKQDWHKKWLWLTGFITLLVVMLVLKNPEIRELVSRLLRQIQGQSTEFATRLDIQWLGFSYVFFRLISTIKDFQNKRLKEVSLLDYVNYVIFFPSFTAGPIDTVQHFQSDLALEENLSLSELSTGAWRLLLGVFKKFAIADTLAIIALNLDVIPNVNQTGFMWLSLYAYAFLIFFDFSGYTDIAIGLGILLGIKMPENFKNPYLKPNLKLFWDNWHITLTQWFRSYYFNPVSRKIRRKWRKMPVGWMVLIMQVTTMLLIGLWHGVTWNFVIWGLWHGLGMFVFNRWNEWFSPKKQKITSPFVQRAIPVLGTILTFNYVALGWIWFALPTVSNSVEVFSKLFGG